MAPPKKPSAAVLAKLQQQLQATPTGDAGAEVAPVSDVPLEGPGGRRIGTRASNKTARPAQIILDNRQKRRSSAEVKAEKMAKKADILAKKLADNKSHQRSLQTIAAEEDRLRMQDIERQEMAERPDLATGGNHSSAMGGDSDMEDQVPRKPGNAASGAVINVSDDDTDGLSLPPDEHEDFYYDEADREDDRDYVVDVSDTESGEIELADVISEEENGYTVAYQRNVAKATGAAKGKKKERGVLRSEVLNHRDVVQPLGITGKRKGHEKALSVDSNKDSGTIVSKAIDDQDNNLPGEFDNDEDHNIVSAVRASKTQGKVRNQTMSGSTATKVDPTKTKAGSGARNTSQTGLKVDRRPGGSSALAAKPRLKAEAHTYALRDLPFPEGEGSYYFKLWREMRASLINWSGTLPDMFSAASHPDFANVVRTLWLEKFTELHDKVNHPAIIAMAGTTLIDHRSAIGKAGLAAVTNKVRVGTPPHEAAAIIAGYAVPRFIYFDPDADTKKGTFLSLIIQETLAAHMVAVLEADKSFGRPVGALALCCAAIERALNGWKHGVNSIEENKKDPQLNRQTAFKADRWGPVAVRWAKAIQGAMTDARWDYLIRESCAHIPDKRTPDDATDLKPFAEHDIRETIEASDDEYLVE
ncbi:hypothetical protein EYR36_010785 [Pleurotus pulmonarius]|nr:hypothetical protein EYR36_010785 [Pleurotus pulmonarius]